MKGIGSLEFETGRINRTFGTEEAHMLRLFRKLGKIKKEQVTKEIVHITSSDGKLLKNL